MNPITGPFSANTNPDPFTNRYRWGYRQARPYNLPLQFVLTQSRGWDHGWTTDRWSTSYSGKSKNASLGSQYNQMPSRKADVYNKAYDRFKGSISDTAGWAENIAQAGKARVMFNDRAVQLGKFTLALAKRDFGRAARILRTPKPSGVSHKKAVSQNFLEWEYGIKPIISDLDSSMKILTSDPGVRKLKGSNRDRKDDVVITRLGTQKLGSLTTEEGHSQYAVTIRSQVRVTNPNLFLANQLGLLDLALPWKLIPFSFVVDWFVNVEQVISSMTDWFGLQLVNPHVTTMERVHYYRLQHNWDLRMDGFDSVWYWFTTKNERFLEFVECRRSLGIPGPTLTVKPFKGFSLQRGAQAIALVLSVLGK